MRAVAIASLIVGCLPATTAQSAEFAGRLEACMQTSASCADYVACSHRAQREFGQPETGSCEVIVDAGADQ